MSFLSPGPFLTRDLPGIGGRLRSRPEDFVVVEHRLAPPDGTGDFVHALIEKRRMSTPELLRRLAAKLAVPSRELGCAGYKDADALTRQWISAPARVRARLRDLDLDRARVLTTELAQRPLAPGDLAGNEFVLVVREIDDVDTATTKARDVLDVLQRRGVPNAFGAQRFGVRGESAAVGRHLIDGDAVAVLDLVLGSPSDAELDPKARAFRSAYARGDVYRALQWVPDALRLERALLRLVLAGAAPAHVVEKIAPRERRFFLAAVQALVFNRVVARRIDSIDRILRGDVLFDAEKRLVVSDIDDALAAREVESGALHPTGPLFGAKTPFAHDAAGAIEHEVIDAEGLDPARLANTRGLDHEGSRRPLRFCPRDVTMRPLADEGAIEFGFWLPPGCFATALVGEVMKVASFPT